MILNTNTEGIAMNRLDEVHRYSHEVYDFIVNLDEINYMAEIEEKETKIL